MRFEDTEFRFAHGKAPKGRGQWAFHVTDRVEYADGSKNETRTVFAPVYRTFQEAKAWCKHNHVSRNTVKVSVGS